MSTQNIYDQGDPNNLSNDIVDVNPVSSQSTQFNPTSHHFYKTNSRVVNNESGENLVFDNMYTSEQPEVVLPINKKRNIAQNTTRILPDQQNYPSSYSDSSIKSQKSRPQQESRGYSSLFKLPKSNLLKVVVYILLPILIFGSLIAKQILTLLVFWILSLIAIKFQPRLCHIVALVIVLFIIISYPITNYITMIGAGLVVLSSLFLGLKPSFSKFNKFITASIAVLIGLWITVPMSQVGSITYLQNQYSSNSIFKTVADSLYVGAGSPELSPASIEKNFKLQISSEIANSIKDKTNLIPDEAQKIFELCKQLGSEQNLNETCNNLDKDQIDKNIDASVSNQVDKQSEDLKKQFYEYPQVQMLQNLLNGLANNNSGVLSSPYFIPSIVLLLIYAILSAILQLISWPIIIILKRVTLS